MGRRRCDGGHVDAPPRRGVTIVPVVGKKEDVLVLLFKSRCVVISVPTRFVSEKVVGGFSFAVFLVLFLLLPS